MIPDPILLSPEPFPLSPDPIHILGFEPWAHIPCYDPDLRVAVFSLRVENRSLFLSRSQLWKAVGSKVNRKCSSFADNAVDNNIEKDDNQCAFIPFMQVFRANRDQNSVVLGLFSPSIKARYIRLHPQTWNVHISMRIELLGCPIGNNYCLYN